MRLLCFVFCCFYLTVISTVESSDDATQLKVATLLDDSPAASNDTKEVTNDDPVVCHHDGVAYAEGERIRTNQSCWYCTCRRGWTKPGLPECAIIDCPWNYYRQRPHCKPEYVEGKCCPHLKCSPPPPGRDPDYLKGKKSTVSTQDLVITSEVHKEIFMYCVIDNPTHREVNVSWTKTTLEGKREPVIQNELINMENFNNQTFALYFHEVNETDAGTYTCHVTHPTAPPQEQNTKLVIASPRPSFSNPACTLPPTHPPKTAFDGSFSCVVDTDEWGYYYDEKLLSCEKHSSGTIQCPGPSANNFATEKECWDHCSDGCYEQHQAGDCDNAVYRYYYHHPSDSCRPFVYSGCGGNKNNFMSEEECYERCAAVVIKKNDTTITKSKEVIAQGKRKMCKEYRCPWKKWLHYLLRGFQPVTDEDACCPSHFHSGDDKHEEKEIDADFRCYHNGRNYSVGSEIQLPDDCQTCRCSASFAGPGSSTCRVINDCDESTITAKLNEGCVPVYVESHCCPTDYQCPMNDTTYRQTGPLSFYKEPEELQCSYGGVLYPRGYQLITDRGSCRTCTCFTPPYFTCSDIECPPHPATRNATLRCETEFEGSCCPNYKCWDILEETNHIGEPQTPAEKEICDGNQCGDEGYVTCSVNYTQCYQGMCEKICEHCAVPMCLHGTIATRNSYSCMFCQGYKTPEEACKQPYCDECAVDENECRAGICVPFCKMKMYTVTTLRYLPATQLKNGTGESCPFRPCLFPCYLSTFDADGCYDDCVCPETPEAACEFMTCSRGAKCEGQCEEGKCSPFCPNSGIRF